MRGDFLYAVSGGVNEVLSDFIRSADEITSAAAKHATAVSIDKKILIVAVFGAAMIIATVAIMVISQRRRKATDTGKDDENDMGSVFVWTPLIDVAAASVHGLGRRKNQEDSFGLSPTGDEDLVRSKGLLAIVADGMGGLDAGEEVSSGLVMSMLQNFKDDRRPVNPAAELDRLLKIGNANINELLKNTVGVGNGGSTLLAAIIRDGLLDWISVGDSRICLFRQGRLIDLNKKHNYGAELDELARRGEISAETARNDPRRAGLTSYVGMGDLKYVDRSIVPVSLMPGDKVVLMSDGIFNTLLDEEIINELSFTAEGAASRLKNGVLAKNNPYQDNFTALILEYTGTV